MEFTFKPERAEDPMIASEEVPIFVQMLIAFGQGTGSIRVSRAVAGTICKKFLEYLHYDHCQARINGKEDVWAAHGPQVLERARAAGRLAAQTATAEGRTQIFEEDFSNAIKKVTGAQDCDWCHPTGITTATVDPMTQTAGT